MKSLIFCLWLLPILLAQELIQYSVEINLHDSSDDTFDLWPIVFEYRDKGAFKAGNLSVIDSVRDYVSLVLTPYGQLKNSRGNLTGFSENGTLGLLPSDAQASSGFSIIDEALYYQGHQNWTVCPFHRGGLMLYTIGYNSNCTGGYNTTIQVVGTDSVTTVTQISSWTHMDSEPSTTLEDNSFESFTEDTASMSSFAYTSSVSYIIALVMMLSLILIV